MRPIEHCRTPLPDANSMPRGGASCALPKPPPRLPLHSAYQSGSKRVPAKRHPRTECLVTVSHDPDQCFGVPSTSRKGADIQHELAFAASFLTGWKLLMHEKPWRHVRRASCPRLACTCTANRRCARWSARMPTQLAFHCCKNIAGMLQLYHVVPRWRGQKSSTSRDVASCVAA